MKSVEIAGRNVPLKIRRNKQAKRILLRFDALAGEIRLTLPLRARLQEGLAFIHQSRGWLHQQLNKIETRRPSLFDGPLTVLGKTLAVKCDEGRPRRIFEEGNCLIVGGPAEHAEARLKRWLKKAARSFMEERCIFYSDKLGVEHRKITLRDTRSRWGSCSASGNLSFSWRLVFAPEAVADYVAAHEVCHLREMNHSPAFWQLVAGLCPDHKTAKAWLRKNGSQLHLL